MLGQMMQLPLLISSLLTHAERHHGEQQVVSRRVEGDVHRQSYRTLGARSRQLAKALAALGVRHGDRVATLAWNGHRHMELYYAVSGSGAVLHTLNPRLHPDQLSWIADHAEDQVLCFDASFLPLVEAVAPRVKTLRRYVLMTDRAHMPAQSSIPGLLCFEELLAEQDDRFEWPSFDENTASSLCYTSGTTGHPKGVLYSHRSTVLHTLVSVSPDALNVSSRDVVLPVVPMFHVNAWGLPYAACMVGARLVFPGPQLDGWFPTGDVASIDDDGFMQITDRSKDVIKSGGEWIGSIDLENIAMAHPAVAMAACIAARHAKWDERPLLIVARKPGASVTRDELLQFYEGKIAKWWTPDDVVFVDAIPLGATGKMLKMRLREQYGNHLLQAAEVRA